MGQVLAKVLSVRVLLLSCLLLLSRATPAQKTQALPRLDLDQYLTAWHVQAWIPNKAEKRCAANVLVLYAAGDKLNSFQMGTFCRMKNGSTQEWSSTGKQDKEGSGKLKLRRLVLLSSPYWVLDMGPERRWALVGTPNHKRLWVMSTSPSMAPELLAEIETKATAQGFSTSKLVRVVQNTDSF